MDWTLCMIFTELTCDVKTLHTQKKLQFFSGSRLTETL